MVGKQATMGRAACWRGERAERSISRSFPLISANSGRALGEPPGEGRDEVFGYCSACHSIRLITQQGLTRADWGEVLVYMVEEHEMAELEPEDEKLVLDYLARFYGRDRRARKMGR